MPATSTFKSACEKAIAFWHPTLGWLPVLALLLYSVAIRIHHKYFTSILIASGHDAHGAGLREELFIYREDLLLFGALTPLLIALAHRHLARRAAAVLTVAWIALASSILYANLQTWGQVGRFLTASGLRDAIAFGLSQPGVIGSYISLGGFVKFLAVLAASSAYYVFLPRLGADRRVRFGLGAAGMLAVALSLAGAAAGYSSGLRESAISRSFLLNAVKSLQAYGEAGNQYADATDDALRRAFGDLSMRNRGAVSQINFGSERKSNLLIFVLETGSIEFLDTRKELAAHPLWDLLPRSRYVSGNHYSTFPASAESNMSILTGMYPPRAYYDTCLVNHKEEEEIPTLIGQMRGRDFKTAAYLPYPSQVPMDKVVFETTGFEKTFYGSQHQTPASGGADRTAMGEMMKDVRRWSGAGQQFAVAFYPQLGHGPWGPELGDSIAERGQTLVRQQLDWLHQIALQLQEAGALEDTVIVITGDHGVRTSQEDPALSVGTIDRYSLNVPLIVVAPNSRYPKAISTRPTSHVDIPAELSHLFGLSRNALIQGLPFLDHNIETRRQFFMANWYFGADGYREPGRSAMYSSVLDMSLERADGVLSFQQSHIVGEHQQETRRIASQILDLQYEWVKRFACGKKKVS